MKQKRSDLKHKIDSVYICYITNMFLPKDLNNKDIQQLIADKLPFEDIRNWSKAYPLSLTDNHNYWKQRLDTILQSEGFRGDGDSVSEYMTYRETPFVVYSQADDVLDIEGDDFIDEDMLFLAARSGSYDLVDMLMQWFNVPSIGMQGAVAGNNEEMVNYFIKLGADDWNSGLYQGVNDDNLYWVKKMIQYGADEIDGAFREAVALNRLEIWEYFIENREELNWEYNPRSDLVYILMTGHNFNDKNMVEWVIRNKDYEKIPTEIREKYKNKL